MDQADKLRQLAQKQKKQVVAVLSGKGGVGKTNLSLSVALLAAERFRKVLLWDCDFSLANCDILLDLATDSTIVEVFQGRKKLHDAIVRGPNGVDVLPGGSGVQEPVDFSLKKEGVLRELLEEIRCSYEFVVIDCAAGIGKNVINLALMSDMILLVTNPEVPAVADAYATLKVLVQSGRKKGIEIIVNMASDRLEAMKIGGRIASVAQRFLGIRVQSGAWIPYDENVVKAVKSRRPFLLFNPESPASRSLRSVWERIIPETILTAGGAQ